MTPYDVFEFMSYETFLLAQYHINCQGLYFDRGRFCIYCPEVTEETLAIDGSNIHEWLNLNRIMSTSITITNELSPNAIKIDEKLKGSASLDSGYLITRPDNNYEIDLLIPKIFPDFIITDSHPIEIIFNEEVSEDGFAELRQIFNTAQFPVPVIFKNGTSKVARPKSASFFQTIVTYRQAKSNLSPQLSEAWEEDEERWVQTRKQIISQSPNFGDSFKPESLVGNNLRCLIDCSKGTADNIRNYLTMYEQICIVAPDASMQAKALSDLGITVEEFKELVSLNKIQVLLPKSIERYDPRLLEELLEIKKTNVHFARTVSSMTFVEMRKRNPFLLPSITTEEKQVLLHSIEKYVVDSVPDKEQQNIIRNVISETGNSWIRLPNSVNQLDSGLLSHLGTAGLIRSMVEFHKKKDMTLEFDLCAPPVEWAAATGSILIPTTVQDYDTEPLSSLVAEMYSGTPDKDWILQNRSQTNIAVENILAISKHLPVIDLATSFNGTEVSRFRDLILDITKHHPETDDFNETIENFNQFVKKYEKNKDNWTAWNIKGFIIGLASKGVPIPMASWLFGHVFRQAIKYSEKDIRLSKALNEIEATLLNTVPDAILVSRMRDKIKKKL